MAVVIGTKFVAMPKHRKPEVEEVPHVAPRSPDEAATEPPTPADSGVPGTTVGGEQAALMLPPKRVPVQNVPPPESARATPDEHFRAPDDLVGPNPSLRPNPRLLPRRRFHL